MIFVSLSNKPLPSYTPRHMIVLISSEANSGSLVPGTRSAAQLSGSLKKKIGVPTNQSPWALWRRDGEDRAPGYDD